MQVLPSNLYMPYVPKDCHHYFKNHEFYPVLGRLFPRNYLNQKKTVRKIPLKEKANTIKRSFPFHFFFSSKTFHELLILSQETFTATAKSLQSCPTLCDPIPGILQARTQE